MNNLTLTVNKQIHEGWQSIRVTRSLNALAHSFELKLTDTWSIDVPRRIIKVGEPCEIHIDGTLIITGYIDDVIPTYDDQNHSITVSGRSKAGDLVDCSYAGSEFKDQTLLQLIETIIKPFGTSVTARVDVGAAFKKVRFEEGETYFEFIDRLAAIRALRVISNASGNLIITRAGIEWIHTPLVLGKGGNIKSASGEFSHRDRFSEYTVRSQQDGNPFLSADAKVNAEGKSTDTRVRRYRPTVTSADHPSSIAECRTRADWKRNTQYGRSRGIVYTLQGWHHEDGLWDYNKRVHVVDDYMGIDEDRVIESVVFTLNDDGSQTELRVTDPAAFDLIPLPDQKGKEASLFAL